MSIGLGVMINRLGGGSPKSASEYYGLVITKAEFDDTRNDVRITFENGKTIRITDDGQSCCESRYMRTDDAPSDLVGQPLTSIEIKEAPEVEDQYGTHEVQFLEVRAGHITVTFANHNEHNGYYGGFSVNLDEVK